MNVGAHTHANITTGLAENKFGISMEDMDKVIDMAGTLPHVKFVGLHFTSVLRFWIWVIL